MLAALAYSAGVLYCIKQTCFCQRGASFIPAMLAVRTVRTSREAELATEQFEYIKLPNGAEGCPAGAEILTFEECRQLAFRA